MRPGYPETVSLGKADVLELPLRVVRHGEGEDTADHAVDQSVVPGAGSEAGGHVGEGQDQEGHQELDQDGDEEETRKVDEADHVDGEFGDDQEDPGDKLEKGAGGHESPKSIT